MAVLLMIVLAAAFAPWLAPYDPAIQLDIVTLQNSAPSLVHPLGTDQYSRDLLSRTLFGARTSLTVGFVATVVATVTGFLWGGVAATAGNRAGECMMLVTDIMRSIPRLLLFLVVVALLGALSPVLLAMTIGAAAWPVIARLTYVLVRELRAREFVEAARAVGATRWSVLSRHVAPHLLGPVSAMSALLLADVLSVESGLSFLGIGVRPPTASWGNMIQDALPTLGSAWWVAAIPCACVLLTILAVSTLADRTHASHTRNALVLQEQ
jgi:ABC-type dipeptide/oligopeptide/nickel transport system permease subunit